jgi:putative transposase
MNFRRYYVQNAVVFITTVVSMREPAFANQAYVEMLRETLRTTKQLHPFVMIAYVILPDHLHLLIRPTGASNFSQIMHSVKSYFSHSYKAKMGIEGRLKFWQKRFHDHIIRDEADLEAHIHYIHYNPVKHGYVSHPEDWPHSSFGEWKARGAYPDRWGWSLPDSLTGFGVGDVE